MFCHELTQGECLALVRVNTLCKNYDNSITTALNFYKPPTPCYQYNIVCT